MRNCVVKRRKKMNKIILKYNCDMGKYSGRVNIDEMSKAGKLPPYMQSSSLHQEIKDKIYSSRRQKGLRDLRLFRQKEKDGRACLLLCHYI
jgi:hypothetical protein